MNSQLFNVSDFLKIGIMAFAFIFLVKLIARKIGAEKLVEGV